MITYNDIYEAAREERYSEQLRPLQKNFVAEVSKYLQEKRQTSLKEIDEFSDVVIKTRKQLENAITLFKEIIIRRRKKILDLVLIANETGISKQDFENMLAFEKELFENLMKCVDSSDLKLKEIMDEKKLENVESNELILFKESVESFLGMDAEIMGPFEKGQIANIPKEIAKILVEAGKAEKIYE